MMFRSSSTSFACCECPIANSPSSACLITGDIPTTFLFVSLIVQLRAFPHIDFVLAHDDVHPACWRAALATVL